MCSKSCIVCACKNSPVLFSDPGSPAGKETTKKKTYEVLLVDPPWSYTNKATRAKAENHYPTMNLQDIKDLVIPAADNSILFLWSTATLLPEAIDVMKGWGFKYKTCACWDKEIIGLGNYFRIQHELLLIGVKGKVQCPAPGDRFSSVIRERRTKHSKKPVRAYEVIERMYSDKTKIELFARNLRPGWMSWGNEI
jgi:N6-adenosine-specific RNA methylase IME4